MSTESDQKGISQCQPIMHLRLWLDTEDGLLFGPGRANLLDLIDRHGSLRQAAKELGISYRAAWGKLRKTEEVLGFKLIDKGESYKEGYRLTEAGRQIKENFARWYKEVEDDALEKARTIFTCDNIEREEATGHSYSPRE
jgi:molybdate transport system regulatory protein